MPWTARHTSTMRGGAAVLPPVKVGGGAANTANSEKRWQAVQRLSFNSTTTPQPVAAFEQDANARSRSPSLRFYAVAATQPTIDHAQGSLETQPPQPSTAEAGSAIDAQLSPQTGQTPLHSPEQKFRNLHVARASPRFAFYSGMQMAFPLKYRNYVTDWQPKASTCV